MMFNQNLKHDETKKCRWVSSNFVIRDHFYLYHVWLLDNLYLFFRPWLWIESRKNNLNAQCISLCVFAFENVAFDRLSLTWHMITSKTHYISFNSILFGSVLFHSIRLYVCLEQVCKYMRSFAICIILLLNAIPLEHVNERYMTLSIKITKSHIVLFFIKSSCQSESFKFLINCLKLQHCNTVGNYPASDCFFFNWR